MPFVVGLTGGAASGKSTAGALFEALGATLLDADAVSHALTGRGGKAVAAIERAFGQDFIQNGALNRPRMRELVFRDATARMQLEALLHPLIARDLQEAVLASKGPYVVLEAALLVEKGSWRTLTNRLLVVDVPENVQIERMMQHRNLTEKTARAIIACQCSRQKRLALADDVLINTGTLTDLKNAVSALHAKYLTLARNVRSREIEGAA